MSNYLANIGYPSEDHYISMDNYIEIAEKIPKKSIILLHADQESDLEGPNEFLRYLEKTFPRHIGAISKVSEICRTKYAIYECLE